MIIFYHNPSAHGCTCLIPARFFQFSHGRNQASVFLFL